MDIFRSILEGVSVERIRGHIQALEGVRHPVVAPEALELAANYIRDSLQSLDYGLTEHRFNHNGGEFRNIIATRLGAIYPEERVIVLAHYDTVSVTPGADDNASGVAVMLELATSLRSFQFERSVQFIGVSLEEDQGGDDSRALGLHGSRALAAHARDNGWTVAGVVVLESVAYASDFVPQAVPAGVPVKVPDTGNFIAVVGNEDSVELTEGFALAIERYGILLPYATLVVPGNGEILPDTRRSDHAPFWDNGYKAIMLTDTTNFRNPHYHLPGDTLVTLNMPFAAQVCRATAGLVIELARPVDSNV